MYNIVKGSYLNRYYTRVPFFLKWQLIFCLLCRFCLSSTTDKPFFPNGLYE